MDYSALHPSSTPLKILLARLFTRFLLLETASHKCGVLEQAGIQRQTTIGDRLWIPPAFELVFLEEQGKGLILIQAIRLCVRLLVNKRYVSALYFRFRLTPCANE